jgi:pilus assembly protein CpaF
VTIEDTAELLIQKPNIVGFECQNDTFRKPLSMEQVLRTALRCRPDRIVVGEVRGTEARTLLDSLNTGHSGSLATIHANSATKALRRFANLVLHSHPQLSYADVEAEIGEAVNYVVHVERQPGRRVIREVLQVLDYNRAEQRFVTEMVFNADTDRIAKPEQPEIPFFGFFGVPGKGATNGSTSKPEPWFE